ncbi:MAG: exodeoxyribonuclease III [Chloroflexi bacterium]|nr:exodeoxyribonuclease III [Chloroflexota bacterium]
MSDPTFRAATFNVNSVRTRMPVILDWLAKEKPDVLCLQETKVQDPDFPADPIREAGYHVAFRGQKAYAGVAIISREEPVDVAYGLDDDGEPDEARLIRAVIRGVPVVNTYVPQGQSVDSPVFQTKLEWLARLRRFFDRHYAAHQPLLWVGDFNVAPLPIDVHDPKRLESHVDYHPDARAALETVRDWGFVDVFRQRHPDEPGHYTYWDYRVRGALERGLGWRIDHIWATAPLAARATRSWIDREPRQATQPSDHTVLAAEFAL